MRLKERTRRGEAGAFDEEDEVLAQLGGCLAERGERALWVEGVVWCVLGVSTEMYRDWMRR